MISRRFEVETGADALDVYRVLRQSNPSPYMYLFNFEDAEGIPFQIVGSSPEALVTLKEGRATSHPIAGSRPRGATREQDIALAEELLADQKERSEHLMLVDLARNDLSRIAKPGTVSVDEFMVIERFSHIMHISSSVSAELDPQFSAYDVLRVAFPAGTLSGLPNRGPCSLSTSMSRPAVGFMGVSADILILLGTWIWLLQFVLLFSREQKLMYRLEPVL